MLAEDLKSIVGPGAWSTDAGELEPHLTEWRNRVRGRTLIMVSPATTAEVADVVRACNEACVGVVPQGGNTGLCGGAVPDDSGTQVLLSLSRLKSIRRIDPGDFSIVVEAGCILADVQQAARSVDRLFPLSLAAEGSCQIGGNLSTNAGGINVLRYGTARQQVLGLEVVLADGTVWDGLRALRKDTAGYDMKQVFIGSEGTLGIITAASLRLVPLPAAPVTALIALSETPQAIGLLGHMREQLRDQVLAFELMCARALRFVRRQIPDTRSPFDAESSWYVLLEAESRNGGTDVEAALTSAIESGLADDAVIAKNDREAGDLWRMRHAISEAQKSEGVSLKHDIAVPIARIAEFLEQAERRIEALLPGVRLVVFGHVGDGNLHYNITQPSGMQPGEFRSHGDALTRAIYDLVAELGGSFSAEHGIGVLKKQALLDYRSGEEIALMRTLKQALDPRNTLNPGKVI